jgi:hypothetical protein
MPCCRRQLRAFGRRESKALRPTRTSRPSRFWLPAVGDWSPQHRHACQCPNQPARSRPLSRRQRPQRGRSGCPRITSGQHLRSRGRHARSNPARRKIEASRVHCGRQLVHHGVRVGAPVPDDDWLPGHHNPLRRPLCKGTAYHAAGRTFRLTPARPGVLGGGLEDAVVCLRRSSPRLSRTPASGRPCPHGEQLRVAAVLVGLGGGQRGRGLVGPQYVRRGNPASYAKATRLEESIRLGDARPPLHSRW